MGADRHKLLEQIDGAPLVRRSAEASLASDAEETVVILGARAEEMRAALAGLPVRIVENPLWGRGVATSIRAGLSAVAPHSDAALIMLADMPEVGADLVNRLIAAFDPEEGREAVRPVDAEGRGGHPVLFGRRYFEALSLLEGDVGARKVIQDAADRRVDLPIDGSAPFVDLDAPEDWAKWRGR
ncbi:MAG: nucleotidyltransferase family protein [Neomegalonema sp.]|nr:nucleotidyltransferase family protein [Neomegalonema sp.]